MWSQLSSFIAAERLSLTTSKISLQRLLLLCNNQQESELRSSLAFKLAYEAAESGLHVFFVCLRGKFDRGFPWWISTEETSQTKSVPSFSSSWSPSVLSRIHIKYVTNTLEIQKVFASMHTVVPRPQCVVIDHLCSIVDPIGTIARNDATFLQACLMIGSFARDYADFFDKDAVSKHHLQQQQQHDPDDGTPEQCRLVITADCFDASFVNNMRRSVNYVLSLRHLSLARHPLDHDHRNGTNDGNQHTAGSNSSVLGMFVKGTMSEGDDVKLFTCTRGIIDNGNSYQLTV